MLTEEEDIMRIRRLPAVIATAVLVAAPGAAPVGAETIASGNVNGGGTISPGLTATPSFQTGTFSGTFIGMIEAQRHVATGVFSCSFAWGSTLAETSLQGQGTANGSCSGGTVGTGTKSCSLNYLRVGSKVITTGQCSNTVSDATGSGSQSGIETGQYTFIPTSGNGVTAPITSFALFGHQEVAGV